MICLSKALFYTTTLVFRMHKFSEDQSRLNNNSQLMSVLWPDQPKDHVVAPPPSSTAAAVLWQHLLTHQHHGLESYLLHLRFPDHSIMSGGLPNAIKHVGFDCASGCRDCERIVLLRYDETHSGWMFNMALMAAICNAHQYPYSHLTIFEPRGMQICHDITGGAEKALLELRCYKNWR